MKKQKAAGLLTKKEAHVHIPLLLSYGAPEASTYIRLHPYETRLTRAAKLDQRYLKAVHTFLGCIPFQPVPPGTPGITWQELLLLFEAHGGSAFTPTGSLATKGQRTIAQRVTGLKQAVRHVTKTYTATGQADWFKAATTTTPRLRSIGFKGIVPTIRCLPVVNEDCAKALLQGILTLRGRPTRRMTQQQNEGRLYLPFTRLSQRGCPRWKHLLTKEAPQLDNAPPHHSAVHTNAELEQTVCLLCRHCGHHKELTNPSAKRRGKWVSPWCTQCAQPWPATHWQCVCQRPWTTCGKHSGSGHHTTTRQGTTQRQFGEVAPALGTRPSPAGKEKRTPSVALFPPEKRRRLATAAAASGPQGDRARGRKHKQEADAAAAAAAVTGQGPTTAAGRKRRRKKAW